MTQNENRPPSLRAFPLLLIAIGLLLLAAVVVWQLTRPVPAQVTVPQPTATNDPNIPFPNIPRLSLEDARAAFDGKNAVFVDVRSPESYAAGHIPGALNIPLNELENRASELDPGDWIITYCT